MTFRKESTLSTRLPLLHAIRGVAALYVVIFHAKFILWSGGREYIARFPRATWSAWDYVRFALDMFSGAGSQMVMIFFVLSGFFIAMSLDNMKGSTLHKLKIFYAVRFTRIYIPYLASIVISIAALYWIAAYSPGLYQMKQSGREFNDRLIDAYHDLSFSNFFKSLIFLKNKEYIGFNYAYWSLLYEVIFYIIVPFTYGFKKYYLITSGILFVAGMYIINKYNPDNIFMKFLFEFNFYFATGQAIYIYRERLGALFQKINFKWPLIISSFILFIVFDVLSLLHQHFWADFVAAVAAALLMILFLNYSIRNNIFIKAVKKLGVISYSLYLVHIPVLIFVYLLLHEYTGRLFFYDRVYIIGVIAAVIAGWIFYRLVEKPSLSVINKIKRRLL